MNRQGHEEVDFFVGTEVEQSPAYGLTTLFVVGIQDTDDINYFAELHGCEHIYFGANHSFQIAQAEDWKSWYMMITDLLERGWLCTLDLDVGEVESLLGSGLCEHHKFIPMISVKLPYANQLNYNATLKIDDKDFNLTNPGVWCHSLHELTRRDTFTDWSKYSKDQCINKEQR